MSWATPTAARSAAFAGRFSYRADRNPASVRTGYSTYGRIANSMNSRTPITPITVASVNANVGLIA